MLMNQNPKFLEFQMRIDVRVLNSKLKVSENGKFLFGYFVGFYLRDESETFLFG
jgi:hypothetical protein